MFSFMNHCFGALYHRKISDE